MTLAELQRACRRALVEGEPAAFEAQLSDAGGRAPAACVGVHRNNLRGALAGALERAYPVCRRILGQDCFGALARDCAVERPSAHYDLNLYGIDFPAFLACAVAARAPLRAFAYLPDLARFEWAHHLACLSQPCEFPAAAFAAAAQRQAGDLRLLLQPGLSLLATPHPVTDIWARNRDADDAAATAPALAGELLLCVHPTAGAPAVAAIRRGDFALLCAIARGAPLAALVERVPDAQARLPDAIRRGWLGGFRAAA